VAPGGETKSLRHLIAHRAKARGLTKLAYTKSVEVQLTPGHQRRAHEAIMDSALAGLIGAGIGAIAGLTGAVVNYRLSLRSQHANWLRDKRQEAYSSTLRYLLRSSGKRSGIEADGTPFIGQDAIKELFDDLSDARSWLLTLHLLLAIASNSNYAKHRKALGGNRQHNINRA
jgi:hypothetical protein